MFFSRARAHGRLTGLPRTSLFGKLRSLWSLNSLPEMTSLTPGGEPYVPRYIDIGINLTDPVYSGVYHGKEHHPHDVDAVINRASKVGCSKLIVTGSDIESTWNALKLAEEHPTVYATAGIHPCSSSVFSGPNPLEPDQVIVDRNKSDSVEMELRAVIDHARTYNPRNLVAFGEFGLDYDRLEFCNKTVQLHSFKMQLKIAASLSPPLPLFLHSRAAHKDFVSLLKGAFGSRLEKLQGGGVVHSFTGTYDEMMELKKLGLYIGINGCSLKTKENCDVVSKIPLRSIMFETDGPWCEVRHSHEGWQRLLASKVAQKAAVSGETAQTDQPPKKQSQKKAKAEQGIPLRYEAVKKEKWKEGVMIKGRNEPCNIEFVAQIVAVLKGVSVEDVCEAAWTNTEQLFGLADKDTVGTVAWEDGDDTNYWGDARNAKGFRHGRYVGGEPSANEPNETEQEGVVEKTANSDDKLARPVEGEADGEVKQADGEVKQADGEVKQADGEVKPADGEVNPDDDEKRVLEGDEEIGFEEDYEDELMNYEPKHEDRAEMDYLLQKLREEDRRNAAEGKNESTDDEGGCEVDYVSKEFDAEFESELEDNEQGLDHPKPSPGGRRRPGRRRTSR